jgi:molybdopterin molybdotransferase
MTQRDPARNDPRMSGFRLRASVDAVVALIDARVRSLDAEAVDLFDARNRVLAADATARSSVPPFDRSAMDGYAVRGEETFGASPYTPVLFSLVGSARPGRPWVGSLEPGQAIEITTGSPMPAGADAVVKVESTERCGSTLSVSEPTPPGRHVGRAGEDVAQGTTVLRKGRVLRPQDLGVLSALGVRTPALIKRPRVTIVISGSELLNVGATAQACQIPDMNSVMLDALVHRDGGLPSVVGPLADDRRILETAIASACGESDLVLVSGGSSAGPEDHAPGIVAELGELAIHGVALRPASPAGFGFVDDVPVFLLPGNPVSCLCAYDFFAGRCLRILGGRLPEWSYRRAVYPLSRKLASVVGRVDYARVRIENGQVEPLAISGASILSSTTKADGFVIVPEGLEGYGEDTDVAVWHYDEHPLSGQ